ncbi:MAG: biotin--[acetyl-CoA-carboxylase] ligase [Niabella sp.]
MAHKYEDNLQKDRFIELLSVDSTNNYALSLLRSQKLTERQTHGLCVFAHEQLQGKGQRGKKWSSAAKQNIQMSVVIAPRPLQIHNQFAFTAIAALAVRRFLEKITVQNFVVKWPNDIYFQDRKAGGILIENIIAGNKWEYAVVGMGLNINQTVFDPALPNPTSLKQITGIDYDCVALAKSLQQGLLQEFERWTSGVDKNPDIEGLLSEYNRYLYKRNETVRLKKDSRVFETTIKGVTENGQLTVHHGLEEQFNFGELVWLI